jgi:hypothetical protein
MVSVRNVLLIHICGSLVRYWIRVKQKVLWEGCRGNKTENFDTKIKRANEIENKIGTQKKNVRRKNDNEREKTQNIGMRRNRVKAWNMIFLKVKAKLSLCLTKQHARKAYWGVKV